MPNIENAVSFRAEIPIAWRHEEHGDAASRAAWTEGNRLLLRACTLSDVSPREAHGAEAHSLERLDVKMDLILYLLGSPAGNHRPPPRLAVMSARSLLWAEDDAPEPGSRVMLSIFLTPRVPLPLRIAARINDLASGDGKLWVRADFDPGDAEVQELLEQVVFRAHRKAVHEAKG